VSQSTALVLLSSYNGARYIDEQIESIRAQTFRDWRLWIRDDGSSDATREIITKLGALDDRIEMLGDNHGNVGPWASFGLLLQTARRAEERYILLADQDDVWLPDKIAHQISALENAEQEYGAEQPVLVHSDLEVVDEKLQSVHGSLREFQGLSHNADDPLKTLLVHNGVVGCTVGLNRGLLEFAVPVPAGCPHDWWLAACAAATGRIIDMKEATVRYRQHASNAVGARVRREFVRRLVSHPLLFVSRSLAEVGVGVHQSRELARRIAERRLSVNGQRRAERYAQAFDSRSVFSRIKSLRESGARPRRAFGRLALYAIAAIYPHWKLGGSR
jgi:glycosyltransferase involved in cell wall biosynthesis